MITPSHTSQRGQTLIETLAAIFILTMGVTAAVGLANFSLGSSTSVTRQIIATGLAREALEAVKNMRDTNWYQGTISDTCYNYVSGDSTGFCYQNWEDTPYCVNPSNSNCNGLPPSEAYSLSLNTTGNTFETSASNPTSQGYWTLTKVNGSFNIGDNYGLATTTSPGLLYTAGSGIPCSDTTPGISDYCRAIILTRDRSGIYGSGGSDTEELKVQSIVWWKDGRKCTLAAQNCKLELDLYLTNWKNF